MVNYRRESTDEEVGGKHPQSICKPLPMLQHLRNTTASLFLVGCVSIVVFWVQSHFSYGVVQGPISSTMGFYSSSWSGQVRLGWLPLTPGQPGISWFGHFLSKEELKQLVPVSPESGFFGFHAESRPPIRSIAAPHWFLAFVTVSIAILLKPKPRSQFSLQEYLLFTSIAAIVLFVASAFVRTL